MATTQILFNQLITVRTDVKKLKVKFDNDTSLFEKEKKKSTNANDIIVEFGNTGSNRNKIRTSCLGKQDLANPTTDPVAKAITEYDAAQANYILAKAVYDTEYSVLNMEYLDYEANNNSLYPILDYLKTYILILTILKPSDSITFTTIPGETKSAKKWLDDVKGKSKVGLLKFSSAVIRSIPITGRLVDDFFTALKNYVALNPAGLNPLISSIVNDFNYYFNSITPLITAQNSNFAYSTALATYKLAEIPLDTEYGNLNRALEELEFISTGNVREPKTLDDAFKTFLAWLKTQPVNDTMDAKHLKYQVTDKLISIEQDLGKTLEKDYTRDDFLSETRVCGINTTGKDCLHILHQCLSGKTTEECLKRWDVMNFSGGVNFLEGDKAVAMKLGKKLGLDINDVKKVCDDFKAATKKDLNPNVVTTLHSIKAVYTNKPSAPVVIPVWTFVPPLIGGKMVGGGSNVSYADFIRGFDSLKNNINISGGGGGFGPNSAIAFRNNYLQLKSILTSNGKTLDAVDDTRMDEYINSIERSEKRLDKLTNLIQILKKLYSDPAGKKYLDDNIGTKKATLELLDDLTEQYKNSAGALTGKISNYFTSYTSLVNSREMQHILKKLEDVEAIMKAKLP